jgi:hypothetical protein
MLQRRRYLRLALALAVVGLTALAVLIWFRRSRIEHGLVGSHVTSVDTMMQHPSEWTDRLLYVEGTIARGSYEPRFLGCSYLLVEGWKRVTVHGRSCGRVKESEGRLVHALGRLRRDGSSFVLEVEDVSVNSENIDHHRYIPPVIPPWLTEAKVQERADEFRRRRRACASCARASCAVASFVSTAALLAG